MARFVQIEANIIKVEQNPKNLRFLWGLMCVLPEAEPETGIRVCRVDVRGEQEEMEKGRRQCRILSNKRLLGILFVQLGISPTDIPQE